ncbi:BTB/POZ domain-containing protein At3g22104-like [Hibiscus syriacus]|uniref:BTB/POZ domain-containing protein At3g22104-like n=1 Tax=Hibiscus syriacus TaxID=106335 RepID=UPI001920E55E|nr:BTB/POZ domain-containing protein At3g22104-like [Hibiscus syriacus]
MASASGPGRLASPIVASPYTSSSENSSFQCSSDTRSSYSIRNNSYHVSWWFEDLLSFLSCKLLFDIYRVASSLKISKHYESILENLIGLQLDQATIDFFLVPSPQKKLYMYDVNLVLRLVNAFQNEQSCCQSLIRFRKVASLLDSYLVEVSADYYLNPSKFAALVLLLPDSARESHDRLFQAIDIYLQVHGGICEAPKMRICSALNYANLSTDALRHLARNSKSPSRIAIQGFLNQQSKLENLLEGQKYIDTFSGFISTKESVKEIENNDQIVVYAKQASVRGKAEQLYVLLQGMQCRVTELEDLWNNACSNKKYFPEQDYPV